MSEPQASLSETFWGKVILKVEREFQVGQEGRRGMKGNVSWLV